MTSRQRFVGTATFVSLIFVSSTRPTAGQSLTIGGGAQAARADLRLTALNDVWSLTNVLAMAVDGRGMMNVWDEADLQIRVFSADGDPLRRLGGRGSGPGEFSQTGTMRLCGDSLSVAEAVTDRVSTFPLTGGARTIPGVTRVVRPVAATTARNLGRVAADGFLGLVQASLGGRSGLAYVTLTPSGAVKDTIFRFEAEPHILQYNVVQESIRGGPVVGRQVMTQPLESVAHTAVAADCRSLIKADVERGLGGGPGAVLLERRALDGRVIWSRRIPITPRVVTNEEFAFVVDGLVAPTVVRNMRLVGDRRMILDSLLRPRYWPAVVGVIAGNDGTIWLKQGGPTADGDRYWRFSENGVYEATISTPIRFRLFAASRQHLWGVRTTAEGDSPVIERYVVR